MPERITRKDLRTDKFAVAVEHNVEYVAEHRGQFIRYAAIGVAVLLAAAAIYLYRSHQHTVRQDALAEAIQIQETAVTPGAQPGPLSFPTDEAKRTAAAKTFADVAAKYPNSAEGHIAEYYLASIAADSGKLEEARKRYQQVAENGDKNYASLARFSLAQINASTGRAAEAEKTYRDLMAHPTDLVSKEQATIALARLMIPSRTAEARKLLEPLASQPYGAGQAAVQLLGELSQ